MNELILKKSLEKLIKTKKTHGYEIEEAWFKGIVQ